MSEYSATASSPLWSHTAAGRDELAPRSQARPTGRQTVREPARRTPRTLRPKPPTPAPSLIQTAMRAGATVRLKDELASRRGHLSFGRKLAGASLWHISG